MKTSLDGQSSLFLADLRRIQRRISEAGRQVSSGKKISAASDAPDEVEPLLQLRADLERNAQIRSNLSMARTEAEAADGALASAIKLLDRARVLAAQGANSVLDSAGRQAIASEIEALQEQMVAYSSTMVQGRYIFSGDADATPSYALDLTAGNGVTQLQDGASTRRIEHPGGGSFAAAMTAQEIFDSRTPDGSYASDNVFAALHALRAALVNDDAAAVAGCVPLLEAASSRLNSAEAFYGTVQGRIRDAQDYASNYDVRLRAQLSDKEDADVAAAAVELTQANTQLQAAFQMRARLPTTTLFDFLG